uniref:Uncharacterized protein n=1 Tax=Oryza meridionalis TaxID=40149 RepID=A0A0E0D6U8_9ORYZ
MARPRGDSARFAVAWRARRALFRRTADTEVAGERGRGQGDTVEAGGRVPCAHRNTGRRSGDGDVRRRRRTGLARRGRGGRRQ